jgi:hypothetical protein
MQAFTLLLAPLQLAALGTLWAATSSIDVLRTYPHVWINAIGFVFAGLVVRCTKRDTVCVRVTLLHRVAVCWRAS